MSAATFLPANISFFNLGVLGDLNVTDDVVVGDNITATGDVGCDNLVVGGNVSLTGDILTTNGDYTSTNGSITCTNGQIRGGTVRSDGLLTVAAGGMSIEGTILQNSGNMTCSAGTVSGLAVNGGTCDFSGNAEFGTTGADTFKAHGATAQSGLQSAFVAQLGAFTDPPTAGEMATLRTAVNSLLTCQIDHGFRAAS